MSDKFKVGQPVWAINESTGKWTKGIVTAEELRRRVLSSIDGRYFFEVGYGVDTDEPTPGDAIGWHYPARNLRPRDEGQFAPADSTFDWRVKEIA